MALLDEKYSDLGRQSTTDRVSRHQIKFNTGDSTHQEHEYAFNEDEEGYEIDFIGGRLLRSKFMVEPRRKDSDEMSDDVEQGSSVSDFPESIEVKTIDSLVGNKKSSKKKKNKAKKKRARPLSWQWTIVSRSHRITTKSKKGAAGPNHMSDYITEDSHGRIEGDQIVLFGARRQIDRTCSYPNDGDTEFVYSDELALCDYSFMHSDTPYDLKAPPPLYMNFEKINDPKPTEKADILNTFFINKNGLLECDDQKIIESNKGVIPYVLKQLAKNILTGKGLVAISLPVRIFQPKSLLERIIDACSFVPFYFKKGCETDDPLLRMKYTISFIVAGLYLSADLRKPFNPILGETLEGYFKDGSKIYMEHISHHPPISSYLIEGPAEYPYRMYGSVEFNGNIKNSGNVLDIFFQGANYIEFPDGHVIEFHYPTTKVSGLMWGNKTVNMEATAILIDQNDDHKAIVIFNPKKGRFDTTVAPTSFEGLIYRNIPDGKIKKKYEKLDDITDIDSEICDVYGDTLKELIIDGEQFWNIDEDTPMRMFPDPYSLPSDSRYREDLLWLLYDDQKYSQKWKEKLEVQQRYDKKLRLDCQKKRKKNVKFIDLKK